MCVFSYRFGTFCSLLLSMYILIAFENRTFFLYFYIGYYWQMAIDFCVFALSQTIILKSLSSSYKVFFLLVCLFCLFSLFS